MEKKKAPGDFEKKKVSKGLFSSKVRNTLVIVTICAIVIPMITLGYFSYQKSFEILDSKLTLTTEQTIAEVNNSVTRFLRGIESQVRTLAENSSFKNIKSDDIFSENDQLEGEDVDTLQENDSLELSMELLGNVTESNNDIMNTYFGTSDGAMHIYPAQDLPEDYDPRSRPWYGIAAENRGQVTWTDPYMDASTNEPVITAAQAVVADGKVVGVIGIDINLGELSAAMQQRKIGREGYVFVTDKNGIMIAHPDKALIGTDDPTKQSFWEAVKSNELGFERYSYEGHDKFLSYITNDITGWKLMAAMDNVELINDTNIIREFTLIAVLIGAIIAIIIAFLIASSISKPLTTLKEAFVKASQGDLTATADIKSNNEFGEIGRSFNAMIENISGLIGGVKNSSHTVLNTSQSLTNITEQTTVATNEVARTIEEIARAANEQAKDTENGALRVNELAEKIEMVLQSTNYMTDISGETDNLTDKGIDAVKTLIEKSKENNEAASKINDIVLMVDRSAEEIGTITDTISGIAEQTNLLALNAAIEAARAGEHGKGFAVVAEEVRKLAEQSSKATQEIRDLISGIQNQSKSAVASMEDAKAIVEAQDTAVEETGSIFDDISTSIKALIDKVAQVKSYSDEMDAKKNEIVGVIENISAASQQTSAATQQVSASTEEQLASMEEVSSYSNELKVLASELENAINKFKIKL